MILKMHLWVKVNFYYIENYTTKANIIIQIEWSLVAL